MSAVLLFLLCSSNSLGVASIVTRCTSAQKLCMVAGWVLVDGCELVGKWFAWCGGWCVGRMVPPTPTPTNLVLSVLSVLLLFHVLSLFCFVLFYFFFAVVCCTACCITSRGGTRRRPDGGARQRFYCKPGVFSFHPSVFLCSSFDVFRIICFFALALSPYIYILFFCLLIYLYVTSFYLILLFVFLCRCFFSLSVYRGSWRMCVVPTVAQLNDMALYYCCLPRTT